VGFPAEVYRGWPKTRKKKQENENGRTFRIDLVFVTPLKQVVKEVFTKNTNKIIQITPLTLLTPFFHFFENQNIISETPL
jgi:hypothetical protein